MEFTLTLKDNSTVKLDSNYEFIHYDAKAKKEYIIPMDKAVFDAIAPKSSHALNQTMIDADGAVHFARELEYIKTQSYDVKYAALKAREVFPVSNEAGEGAEFITYNTFDQAGVADIINNYADDLPQVDVAGKQTIVPVKSLGIGFSYSIQELAAAAMVNRPIDRRRGAAAARGNEQKVNEIAFFGDAPSGLQGFFDNPNIPAGVVVNPGSGTEWVNKTPDQILFDVNDLFADIFETTKMVERPNTLLIPPKQFSYIFSTPRSTNSDTTIAQYLIANSQYLNSPDDIIPLNECAAENNPQYAQDVMVAYDRDPEKLTLEIPLEHTFEPVQRDNLRFKVPTHSRIGGVIVYYPLSAAIKEGI